MRGGGRALFGGTTGRGLQVCRLEAAGGLPEALEIVVPAGVLGEDVNNEVDVIEQNPLGLVVALGVRGVEAEAALKTELDFVGNGLDLARVGAAAENEIVGEGAGVFVEFEDGDVFGFLVLGGGDGFDHLAAGFVNLHERRDGLRGDCN